MDPSTQAKALPTPPTVAPTTLDGLVGAATRAALALAGRAHMRFRQHCRARAAYDALSQLDDRALRDIGFDRSEMTSVAAEVAGVAEPTRVRTLVATRGI